MKRQYSGDSDVEENTRSNHRNTSSKSTPTQNHQRREQLNGRSHAKENIHTRPLNQRSSSFNTPISQEYRETQTPHVHIMTSTEGIRYVKLDLYDNMKARYQAQNQKSNDEIDALHQNLDNYAQHITDEKDKNEGLRMDLNASKDELYDLELKLRKNTADKNLLLKQKDEIIMIRESENAEFKKQEKNLERENYDLIQLMNNMHEKEAYRDNEVRAIVDAALIACQGGQDAINNLEKSKKNMEFVVRSLSAKNSE